MASLLRRVLRSGPEPTGWENAIEPTQRWSHAKPTQERFASWRRYGGEVDAKGWFHPPLGTRGTRLQAGVNRALDASRSTHLKWNT